VYHREGLHVPQFGNHCRKECSENFISRVGTCFSEPSNRLVVGLGPYSKNLKHSVSWSFKKTFRTTSLDAFSQERFQKEPDEVFSSLCETSKCRLFNKTLIKKEQSCSVGEKLLLTICLCYVRETKANQRAYVNFFRKLNDNPCGFLLTRKQAA